MTVSVIPAKPSHSRQGAGAEAASLRREAEILAHARHPGVVEMVTVTTHDGATEQVAQQPAEGGVVDSGGRLSGPRRRRAGEPDGIGEAAQHDPPVVGDRDGVGDEAAVGDADVVQIGNGGRQGDDDASDLLQGQRQLGEWPSSGVGDQELGGPIEGGGRHQFDHPRMAGAFQDLGLPPQRRRFGTGSLAGVAGFRRYDGYCHNITLHRTS